MRQLPAARCRRRDAYSQAALSAATLGDARQALFPTIQRLQPPPAGLGNLVRGNASPRPRAAPALVANQLAELAGQHGYVTLTSA